MEALAGGIHFQKYNLSVNIVYEIAVEVTLRRLGGPRNGKFGSLWRLCRRDLCLLRISFGVLTRSLCFSLSLLLAGSLHSLPLPLWMCPLLSFLLLFSLFYRSFPFPRLLSSMSNKWASKFGIHAHTHTHTTLGDDENDSALAAINLTDCRILRIRGYVDGRRRARPARTLHSLALPSARQGYVIVVEAKAEENRRSSSRPRTDVAHQQLSLCLTR